MPARGRLLDTVYVPGRLFSVNAATARRVPRLFARNERVLTLFEGDFGQFAVVLVGALNVGSMATVWAGDITPAARRAIAHIPARDILLDKGAELGRFNMGSTVIVLFRARTRALASRACSRNVGAHGRVPGRALVTSAHDETQGVPPAATGARPRTLAALRRRRRCSPACAPSSPSGACSRSRRPS